LNDDRSLLYRLVGVGKITDTQVNYADDKRAFLAPSLTWRGRRGWLTGYGEYQYDRSKNTNAFLGREGTLDPAPNGPIPTDLFIGEPNWDRYGGTRRRVGYETSLGISPTWRLRHSLRYDSVDGLMKAMYAAWWTGFVDANGSSVANGRYLDRYWYVSDDRARITATEALLEGRQRTGRIEHTLLVGLDAVRHNGSQTTAEELGTPLDVYTPVYGSFEEPTFGDATPTETAIRRIGFFAQDQMKLGSRTSVRAGVRRDRVTNTIIGSERTVDWATTGNVGLVYQLTPGLAPYTSYSQSFDPVAGTDAEGRAFKPKRGEQIEAGVKWESQAAPVQGSAAYYTITERNRLANDPNDFNRSIQIGEAHIKGVELEGRSDFARWTVMSSYTWMQAQATATSFGGNLDPGQQLEGIPEHQASLWLLHDFAHVGLTGVSGGGGLRYVGRIGDGTGQVFVPDVTLIDLAGSYAVRNWRISVNVNNVADKPYIATCLARGDCWFGQRRTVSLTAGFTY
jgi:iron complex outermembrane recepter protein